MQRLKLESYNIKTFLKTHIKYKFDRVLSYRLMRKMAGNLFIGRLWQPLLGNAVVYGTHARAVSRNHSNCFIVQNRETRVDARCASRDISYKFVRGII